MVLGEHGQRRGIYGPAPTYTCRPRPNDPSLEELLDTALARLPTHIFTPVESTPEEDAGDETVRAGTADEGVSIREGSYFVDDAGRLMQIVNGAAASVAVKKGKGGERVAPKAARIIRALIPIRDALREVLRAQAADRPWEHAQVRLRVAYSGFVRYFGPINHTIVTITTTSRPARNGRSIVARTWHPSPTTPIAGWWPASRTTTSRAGSPAWARFSATASSRPRRRR